MSRTVALANHLAPDSINRLERAAEQRYNDAESLVSKKRSLAALYLLGYTAEMCLSAAYYRSAGFDPNAPIAVDTRRRRMAQARQLRATNGQPLMSNDPHPVVGWARFLEWQRTSSAPLTARDSQRLREAIRRAELVYKHWRPSLRYKITSVMPNQLEEVRKAAFWFLEQRGRL
jgi:hypothetical protein